MGVILATLLMRILGVPLEGVKNQGVQLLQVQTDVKLQISRVAAADDFCLWKGRFLAEIAAAEGSPASLLTSYVLPAERAVEGREKGGAGFGVPWRVHHRGEVGFDANDERSCDSLVKNPFPVSKF